VTSNLGNCRVFSVVLMPPKMKLLHAPILTKVQGASRKVITPAKLPPLSLSYLLAVQPTPNSTSCHVQSEFKTIRV
jgi:hypothetical protein